MKIKFLTDVKDKNTGELYKKGKVKTFDEERAKELLKFKFNGKDIAEEVKEKKSTKKTETTDKE